MVKKSRPAPPPIKGPPPPPPPPPAPPAPAISIQHGHDEVQLSIANEAGDHPLASVPSTGVGIIGMAERAEALGGTLTAQLRADGQFEVAATIPYPPRTPGNSTP